MTSAEKLKLKFKKYLEENTLNVEGQDGTTYKPLLTY